MTTTTSVPHAAQHSRLPPEARATAKIMIVDDDPVAVSVIRRYLVRAGYRDLLTTTDPRQVLDLVARQRPDLVLLDIIMPYVSGLELLQEIRSRQGPDAIPVIIFTAADDRKTKIKALQLGASDFLNKPLDPSDLAARVRNNVLVKQQRDQLCAYSRDLEQRMAQLVRAEASLRDYAAALETGNEKLRKFRDKVQNANAAKSDALAEISRRIRAKLTTMVENAAAIVQHPSASSVAAAERILSDAKCLLDLVADALDFTRIEAAASRAERGPCAAVQMTAETSAASPAGANAAIP